MHWGLKLLFIFLGGLGFYVLTGDGSETILLIIILSYIEFRLKRKE